MDDGGASRGDGSEHVAAAWVAAPAFGLEPSRIKVLSRSENVVCDVTMADGSHLVMRLHRPGYNTIEELEFEVLWVQALAAAGIPVPRAIATTRGRYYTTVDVGGVPHQVGVVEWVNGIPLRESDHFSGRNVVPQYHRIGQLAAQLRRHNQTWVRPAGFTRRRWDVDGLMGDTPLWGRFWDAEGLTDDQRSLFIEARSVLFDELAAMPGTDEHFGLIHSDLHLGNVMTDGEHLTVIDFDDAGFGWFMHELAVALHPVLHEPWFAEAREAIIAGYRVEHPLSEQEEGWIDTFLTVRSLMLVGWLDARRELPGYAQFADLATETETTTRQYLAAR